MIDLSIFKSTLKQGIIMGLCFCSYTLLMWISKLDTLYLNIGQYFDMAIVILPVVIIFWAIQQENTWNPISVMDRIIIAIYVGLISFLIYHPFLYTYHHYINPDWFDSVLQLKEAELTADHVAQDEIILTLQKMKELNAKQSGMFHPGAFLASVLILPTLISLISILFIRPRKMS